jgi:hypothetical protein
MYCNSDVWALDVKSFVSTDLKPKVGGGGGGGGGGGSGGGGGGRGDGLAGPTGLVAGHLQTRHMQTHLNVMSNKMTTTWSSAEREQHWAEDHIMELRKEISDMHGTMAR